MKIESPYRPPQYDGPPLKKEQLSAVAQYSPKQTVKIYLKWTLICVVSAAPSFVLGLVLDGAKFSAIAGMVTGVLVFVFAYTVVEHHPFIRKRMKLLAYRRTAWIGYGTRIAISIIFPIGFYLDLIVGMFTVSVCGWFFRLAGMPEITGSGPADGSFVTHFIMTVVQGFCLNVILFGYLGIVFAIVFLSTGGIDGRAELKPQTKRDDQTA